MNENSLQRALAGLMLALMFTVSGCAVKGNAEPEKAAPVQSADASDVQDNGDPLEGLNRAVFKVNEVLDGLILKPLAHIYLGVFPTPVRNGVHNAITNLNAPVVAINSALQADGLNTGRTIERFVINSTVGIAGIFDVASDMGIPKEHKKDFGQTLGVWGVSDGAYLSLPILGPSNLRDGVGIIADTAMDPFTWIFNENTTIALDSIRIIDRRAELLPITDRIYRDSLDPYASIRSIYQQHRAKVIKNYRNLDTYDVDTGKKK